MPDQIDEIDHGGETWRLKSDTLGRVYAVRVGHGKVNVDDYERAKANRHLSDHE